MPDAVRENGPAPGCPDDDELASYLDGAQPAARQAEITAHLARCERCYELVAEVMRAQPKDTPSN
jgi:anti-sigma factor RsiW